MKNLYNIWVSLSEMSDENIDLFHSNFFLMYLHFKSTSYELVVLFFSMVLMDFKLFIKTNENLFLDNIYIKI